MIINFDYGNFDYKILNFGSDNLPIIKGKFNLNITPIKNDFHRFFWFYDQSRINKYKWFIEDENRNYEKMYCLGPYFPFWIQKELNTHSPAYTEIILNSKTRKILEVKDKNWTDSYKYERTEGRKQQLKILSNFYAHYLISNSFNLQGTFIPVPARPSYSFNSVDIISSEFAKIFNQPHNNQLINRPTDEEQFILQKEPLSNHFIIFDDVFKNGSTKTKICELLNRKSITSIEIVCLGKRDHLNYYNS